MNVIPDRVECHVNFRYAPGPLPVRGRGPARRAVRRPRRAADRRQRALRARSPPGPAVDALVAAGDLARAPKQAWTPVAEFGQAGPARRQLRPRRARAGPPARRVRPDRRAGPVLRDPRAVRRVKLAPALTGMQTYPFVRLAEEKRRLLAAGVDLIDFGMGEPREETPAFIRAALADAIEPLSAYPAAEGLPELREAVAAWVARRFGRELDAARADPADARLQGGDLPPRPRARREPRRRARARLPGLRAGGHLRGARGRRAAAHRGARLPARPRRRARRDVARDRGAVAQLPEQPDGGDRAARPLRAGRRAGPRARLRASPPTRRTPSSTSARSRPPRRCSWPTCATWPSSTRSPSGRRCPATAPASSPATPS